jgi:hypothetical protein
VPSPDARPYLDLTLFDVGSSDIFMDALERARQELPEWEPREGQIELVLLEALAFEIYQTISAINRLPNSMTEILLKLFGIERQSGIYPAAEVLITAYDGDETRVVPAGTRMFYSDNTGTLLVFQTNEDVTLNDGLVDGKATGAVAITGTNAAETYNGLSIGTSLTLLSPTAFIASIVLTQAVSDGATAETDSDYFNRGMLRLNRLTEALVRPEQFNNYVLEQFGDVKRAFAVDNMAITVVDDEIVEVPDSAGHVAIYVLAADGALVSEAMADDIHDSVQDLAQVNLEIHVTDAVRPEVDVVAEVAVSLGYSSLAVQAACEAAITEFFNPNTSEFRTRIRLFQLATLLDNVPGVEYVSSISLTGNSPATNDGDDVVCDSPGTLFAEGTVTINLTTS